MHEIQIYTINMFNAVTDYKSVFVFLSKLINALEPSINL